jgi:hypothetical protein
MFPHDLLSKRKHGFSLISLLSSQKEFHEVGVWMMLREDDAWKLGNQVSILVASWSRIKEKDDLKLE